MEKLVVTRHWALIEYLRKHKLIEEDTPHISFARNEQAVKGKHVFGVLPYWLAAAAEKITEVQIRVPPDKKGKELTLEDLERYALKPVTYVVRRVE